VSAARSVRGLGAGVLCFGCFSVLASVRGLGTGVDVGAAAPGASVLSGATSCYGGSVIGSCGARPRGRCVVFGLYGFRPVSLINWSNFPLLNE
jgi:hypothetical protein